MIVYKCDLCGEVRDCTQREIEHIEYDICAECWDAMVSKLKGKGRPRRHTEIVAHPAPAIPAPTREPKQPFPGAPPTIYSSTAKGRRPTHGTQWTWSALEVLRFNRWLWQ
jgi:hypothetical protein